MFNRILRRVLKHWSLNDKLPLSTTIIVPISYGATNHDLSKATEKVVGEVNELYKNYRNSKILWGEDAHNPNGLEAQVKYNLWKKEGIYIGKVKGTIDGCRKVKKKLEDVMIKPYQIIIVCGDMHSRQCRLVWKQLFPTSEIFFRSVSVKDPSFTDLLWSFLGWFVYRFFGKKRIVKESE